MGRVIYVDPNAVRRFLVVPGYVRSSSDGQLHYIGYARLRELYGVRSRDRCREVQAWEVPALCWAWPEAVPLEPREDGDYSLAKAFDRWRPAYLVQAELRRRAAVADHRARLDDLSAAIDDFELRHPQLVPLIERKHAALLRAERIARFAAPFRAVGAAFADFARSMRALGYRS